MLDLSGHDGALHAFALKSFDQLGKFSQRQPVNGGRAAILDFRGRFFLDRGHDYFVSLSACGVEHEERELAVAGDEAEAHKQWSVVSGQWSVPRLLATDY